MPGKLNTVMIVEEVADHIALFEEYDSILIELYHSKKSGGEYASSRLGDVYEVTSQVIKSTFWINRPQELLDKIKSRIHSSAEYLIDVGNPAALAGKKCRGFPKGQPLHFNASRV